MEKKNKTRFDETVVPIAHEELRIAKRTRLVGKTRINKIVEQEEQMVDEPCIAEEIQIAHVPINQFVDEPPQIRQDGETTIIPVLEEVLVLEKRLLLKEELHISKRRKETRKPQKVLLRREKVVIEHDDLSQSDRD